MWPDKIAEAVPLSRHVQRQRADQLARLRREDRGRQHLHVERHRGRDPPLRRRRVQRHADVHDAAHAAPTTGRFDIETAYLLWNDIVGPRHAFNLWVGRLFAPQLTSFGLHSDYLSDTRDARRLRRGPLQPERRASSLGQGHTDGVELNGIVGHRFGYSLGWVASSTARRPEPMPNAEDVYAHIGMKSGGVALDGEGKYGPNVPDPRKPWAEKAITLDLFAYHGMLAARQRHGHRRAPAPPAPSSRTTASTPLGGVDPRAVGLAHRSGRRRTSRRHDRPYAGRRAGTGRRSRASPDFTGATGRRRVRRDRLRRLALVRAGRARRVHAARTVEASVEQGDASSASSRHRDARAPEHQGRRHRRPRAAPYGLPPVGSLGGRRRDVVARSAGSTKFQAEQHQRDRQRRLLSGDDHETHR